MSRLILVAAGGLAREVIASQGTHGRYERILLVDDHPALWGQRVGGHTVVGGLDIVQQREDHEVLVCAGRGASRRSIVDRLTAMGVRPDRFATGIDPQVRVPAGCAVGAGSIVLAGAVLTSDVRVGRHSVVMPNATLTHDDHLDDYVTICAGVAMGGGVRVGPGAYVGMNASVRQGVVVGAGAVVGMGAAVLEDVPAGETWVGVPARRLRRLTVEMGEMGESA